MDFAARLSGWQVLEADSALSPKFPVKRARENQPARDLARVFLRKGHDNLRDRHPATCSIANTKRKPTKNNLCEPFCFRFLGAIVLLASFGRCSTTVKTDSGHAVTTGVPKREIATRRFF